MLHTQRPLLNPAAMRPPPLKAVRMERKHRGLNNSEFRYCYHVAFHMHRNVTTRVIILSRDSNRLFVALRSSLGGQFQGRRGIITRHVQLDQLYTVLANSLGLLCIDNSLEACRKR